MNIIDHILDPCYSKGLAYVRKDCVKDGPNGVRFVKAAAYPDLYVMDGEKMRTYGTFMNKGLPCWAVPLADFEVVKEED